MQIRIENFEKCYPKRLKKFFQTNFNYKTYDEFIPKMGNAVVGNLPVELIQLFPKEQRGINAKEFLRAFSDFAKYLRAAYSKARYCRNLQKNYFTNRPTEDMIEFSREISNVFNNILKRIKLDKKLNAEVELIDYGAYASVYRLRFNDAQGKRLMHDKALKVYYNLRDNHLGYKSGQNNIAEANLWTFLKFAAGHDLSKTQFTKHYISDMKSGYVLTEFADAQITRTKSKLNIKELLGIALTDMINNPMIFGKIYEVGGSKKLPNFISDKMVRRFFKKLYHRNSQKELQPVLDNLKLEASNPKNEHRCKIQKALELFELYQKTCLKNGKNYIS